VKSLPLITLFAPTEIPIEVKAVICAVGISFFSISLAIVAPQRVQVPQVEVNITASIPLFFSSSIMDLPISLLFFTLVPIPEVTK